MANRAYLYASDTNEDHNLDRSETDEYYDSRWTIPVAWWLLFGPADLRFIDVHFEKSAWQRLRFVSERSVAIDRFKSNRHLLDALVQGHVDPLQIEYFLAVLSKWPGRYLFMDPDEIFEGDPVEDAATILPILNDLEQGRVKAADLLLRIKSFSAIGSGDRALVMAIGYTYGQIGRDVLAEMDDSNS